MKKVWIFVFTAFTILMYVLGFIADSHEYASEVWYMLMGLFGILDFVTIASKEIRFSIICIVITFYATILSFILFGGFMIITILCCISCVISVFMACWVEKRKNKGIPSEE